MKHYTIPVVETLSLIAVLVTVASQPAAAIHGLVGCEGHSELTPVYLFFHQVVLLVFGIGGLLAAGALAYAGVEMMWGSEDAKRKAIERVQRVLLGVGVIWTAPFIIAFLLLPFNLCTGGV